MMSKSKRLQFVGRDRLSRGCNDLNQCLEKPSFLLAPVNDKCLREIVPPKLPPIVGALSSSAAASRMSSGKHVTRGSNVPLALQLEAFVRKEHTLYLREHRDCTHADTLHIVREAFSVIIEHFLEYRGVLSFVRDEYEATLEEVMGELRRLRMHHFENESERSLHIMELTRQRESFTSIISNLQARLHAAQGLTHSLRDQLATLEKSNSALAANFELKQKECENVMVTSKMLANSMIEETARNSQLLELRKVDARELGRLNAHVQSLKEKLEDSEKRFVILSREIFGRDVEKRSFAAEEKHTSRTVSPQCDEEGEENKDVSEMIVLLQRRIDDLLFVNEQLKLQVAEAAGGNNPETNKSSSSKDDFAGEKSVKSDERENAPVCSSELIQSWLQEEELSEKNLDAFDFLLPPGNHEDDPLGFLKVCHPIRNLRMKKKDVVNLICVFWQSRQFHRQMSLKHYFLEWLRGKAGTENAAKEVGVNMLQVCQQNMEDPECRGMILTLRSFLPEDMVLTWKKDIHHLKELCSESLNDADGTIQTSLVEKAIRRIMPEKSYIHMLQLRLYLWRLSSGLGTTSFDLLFNENSHFTYMLKKQFLYEIEEFTLQVVEAVRTLSEDSITVRLQDVTSAISKLDKSIPKGTLHRLVAEATQLTAMDVAIADANFRVKLQPLLRRFRTTVLLRRVKPAIDDWPVSCGGSSSLDGSVTCDGNKT